MSDVCLFWKELEASNFTFYSSRQSKPVETVNVSHLEVPGFPFERFSIFVSSSSQWGTPVGWSTVIAASNKDKFERIRSNDVSLEVTIGPVFQHSANYSEEEISFDLDISEYEAVKEFYVCVSDEPVIQTNIPNRLENQLLTGEYDSPSSEWEHILTEDTWQPILGSLCSSEKVSFLLPSLGDREWPHRQGKHGVMDSKGIFRSIPGKGLGHVNLGARFSASCISWRSMAAKLNPHPAPQLPWLMLSKHNNDNADNKTRGFFSLSEERIYSLNTPKKSCRYCGSSHGWPGDKTWTTDVDGGGGPPVSSKILYFLKGSSMQQRFAYWKFMNWKVAVILIDCTDTTSIEGLQLH
ncbi:hypothetical protein HHK36_027379 [Tetracentron sinense]|uniref:Uncharacterized protein n=1 Tax=Tetracentron sinense TaxID=13715 RepID=A0A834YHT2_TETSI|nr:hypothetical protein HHK36_027379 [Tetracentron sinense]